jgi:colanic acid biosynthesis glycosyl transferase WcaI
VRESGAGWAVAPGDVDALETAIRHAHAAGPGALAGMGQQARQYYEANLSQERGIAAVEGLLSEMCGKAAVPAPAVVST